MQIIINTFNKNVMIFVNNGIYFEVSVAKYEIRHIIKNGNTYINIPIIIKSLLKIINKVIYNNV